MNSWCVLQKENSGQFVWIAGFPLCCRVWRLASIKSVLSRSRTTWYLSEGSYVVMISAIALAFVYTALDASQILWYIHVRGHRHMRGITPMAYDDEPCPRNCLVLLLCCFWFLVKTSEYFRNKISHLHWFISLLCSFIGIGCQWMFCFETFERVGEIRCWCLEFNIIWNIYY